MVCRTHENPDTPEQPAEIGRVVGHLELVSLACRRFNQNGVAVPADVDRHQIARRASICSVSHLGSLLRSTDKTKDPATLDGWHSAYTIAPNPNRKLWLHGPSSAESSWTSFGQVCRWTTASSSRLMYVCAMNASMLVCSRRRLTPVPRSKPGELTTTNSGRTAHQEIELRTRCCAKLRS